MNCYTQLQSAAVLGTYDRKDFREFRTLPAQH